MTYVFGCIKIRKKDKLLLSKHGLNTKLKIPPIIPIIPIFQVWEKNELV